MSAWLRSVSARSILAPAVTSSEVSSVAPSGRGKAAQSMVIPSVREIRTDFPSRRSDKPTTIARNASHSAGFWQSDRQASAILSICGRSRRFAGSIRHISQKTGLNSFMRPSAPNTTTPSLSASSVSPCTWVRALTCEASALTHVQGETLDALKEGVVVFGADGRMKLFNPVFCEMWRIDPANLRDRPHIDKIADACRSLCQNPAEWDALRAMVVGLSERREGKSVRISRTDGMTIDCAALPLPDGATLLTSLDVTAGANIERALTERNQALIAAEKLRNDFVNHVSYELRTPLTNIIGFTQLLAAGGVGPLNPKQLEYAGFITNSSHALLAIIDDILDLASIDAGALELRLETVDVAEAMKAAAAGVQDRLDEAAIEMRMVMTDGVGAFKADGRRVRQVLFNLLSNAINYSQPGQTVTLAAT